MTPLRRYLNTLHAGLALALSVVVAVSFAAVCLYGAVRIVRLAWGAP